MQYERHERETELEIITTEIRRWKEPDGALRITTTVSTLTFRNKADKEEFKRLREYVLSQFKPRP